MNLKALQTLGYGVYVITSRSGEKLNGQIANTVFQITSEPPTVAVSINKNNLTWTFIKESGVFAVSILCQDTPLEFIGRFGFKSGRDIDKLDGVEFKVGQTQVPIVTENTTSYLECKVVGEMDLGTHTLFVGELVDAGIVCEKPCMTYAYYHQVKRGATPKSAPSYVEPSKKEVAGKMASYKCAVCGWVYDPEVGDQAGGIAPGTPFENLPDTWVCPVCGAGKGEFEKIA